MVAVALTVICDRNCILNRKRLMDRVLVTTSLMTQYRPSTVPSPARSCQPLVMAVLKTSTHARRRFHSIYLDRRTIITFTRLAMRIDLSLRPALKKVIPSLRAPETSKGDDTQRRSLLVLAHMTLLCLSQVLRSPSSAVQKGRQINTMEYHRLASTAPSSPRRHRHGPWVMLKPK